MNGTYTWLFTVDHASLAFIIMLEVILTCIGLGVLMRLVFALYRTVREITQTLTVMALRMEGLQVSINGRFDIIHQQLLNSQAQNITLREQLAVAEHHEQREHLPSGPTPPLEG